MTKIVIDNEKCIKCGACVKDCITYSLEQDENGNVKVAEKGESLCISCQHCFAICPVGAISFDDKKPQDAELTNYGNPEDVLNLIKSRRSIRQFQGEEISSEDFLKIKKMLPYIPTGCNYRGLHFSIIESKAVMDEIRNYVNRTILKLISNKWTSKYAGKFVKFKTAFENGDDIIFRNAPHMVVVSSHIHAPCATVDPIIALSYLELYAQSLGLGTCWCGFAQACFKLMPKLSKIVNIPDKYKPVYVMLVGKPAVKYHRTVLPKDYPISVVDTLENSKISFTEIARRILLNFVR